jgi:hypothetical protein
MSSRFRTTVLCWVAVGLLVAGCSAVPAPIVIHEDRRDAIRLTFDPEAGTGHSHPFSIGPEQMARVLRGLWVTKRDVLGAGGLFREEETTPAFSASEIAMLAPFLSVALKKASPRDLVTFYLTRADATSARLVTSGGLFVRNDRLSVILANFHTSPSSGQYEDPKELDTRDDPLLPIARYRFAVGFGPPEAWIPNTEARAKDRYRRYPDESKLAVIDLQRLFKEPEHATSPAVPQSASPRPR